MKYGFTEKQLDEIKRLIQNPPENLEPLYHPQKEKTKSTYKKRRTFKKFFSHNHIG